MEAGPQYLQSPSKKHTQDASIEEGHHEASAVFTQKAGNMFNQPIYELQTVCNKTFWIHLIHHEQL